MSGALRLTVDPSCIPMRRVIRLSFESEARIVLLTARACSDLVTELGGQEHAAAYLVRLCKRFKKPCSVNIANADGSSRSVIFSPPGWTQERLTGYVGGLHGEIEQLFGEISHLEQPMGAS
jgi:hypothetical protein